MELLDKFLAFFTPELLTAMAIGGLLILAVPYVYYKLFLKPKIEAGNQQQNAQPLVGGQIYRKPKKR